MAGPSIILIHDSATGDDRTLTTGDLVSASGSPSDPSIVQGTDGASAERLATLAEQQDQTTALEAIQDATESLSSAIAPYNSLGVASGTAKNSAGSLRSLIAHNRSTTTTLYLWLFDNTTQSGTALWQPIVVPAGAQVGIGTDIFGAHGITATTGISWGFSSTAVAPYTVHVTGSECSISMVHT